MILSDLLQNLSFGELQNLAIGGDGSGAIPAAHQPRLISLANQSLKALFTKFNLLEKEVIVAAQDDITIYYLQKAHAVTDATAGVTKYLTDSASAPFLGDVAKVLTVYNEAGEDLPIDDPEDTKSVFLPAYDVLQIPQPVTGNSYFVMFQAQHPLLSMADLTQNIMLPYALEPALQAHIAFRIFSGMNGQEHAAKAQEQYQLYQKICQDAEDKDLTTTSQSQRNDRFDLRGWI